MPNTPSTRPQLPDRVAAPPDAVLDRLRQRLLPIGSLWFPTPRELREWSASGVPLYVRRIGGRAVEIGPRLASMWAACFAPAWVGQLAPTQEQGDHGEHTVIRWSRRLPVFTMVLLLGWWLVLIGWPIVLLQAPPEDDPGRWWVFWAFLAVASTAGPAAGAMMGRHARNRAVTWLVDALEHGEVEEDW